MGVWIAALLLLTSSCTLALPGKDNPQPQLSMTASSPTSTCKCEESHQPK